MWVIGAMTTSENCFKITYIATKRPNKISCFQNIQVRQQCQRTGRVHIAKHALAVGSPTSRVYLTSRAITVTSMSHRYVGTLIQ